MEVSDERRMDSPEADTVCLGNRRVSMHRMLPDDLSSSYPQCPASECVCVCLPTVSHLSTCHFCLLKSPGVFLAHSVSQNPQTDSAFSVKKEKKKGRRIKIKISVIPFFQVENCNICFIYQEKILSPHSGQELPGEKKEFKKE